MEYKDLNDYELVSMVMEDEEATDVLFTKYMPLIHQTAHKLYTKTLNTSLDYNDLVQEGMVGFSMAISTYRDKKDTMFYTYAKACIERKMYSCIRSNFTQKQRLLNESVSMDAIAEEEFTNSLDKIIGDSNVNNPMNIMVDNENVFEIITGLNEVLTDFEFEVFELKRVGFTYKEISEILDVDSKSVDNALQRIKTKLKKYLELKRK